MAVDAGEGNVGAGGTPLHLDGRAGHADTHMMMTWSQHTAQCRALVWYRATQHKDVEGVPGGGCEEPLSVSVLLSGNLELLQGRSKQEPTTGWQIRERSVVGVLPGRKNNTFPFEVAFFSFN